MASHLSRAAAPGVALAAAMLLSGFCAAPASAQALRASSSNSLAAGATADRNSTPTSSTTGLPGATARQTTSTGTGWHSPVSILGMPLRVAAPVTPAYNNAAAFSTFAGQPENGKDAVLQQSIDGAP